MDNLKKCKKCLLSKDKKEFCKNKRKKDGLDIYCKDCTKIRCKAYRDKPKKIPINKMCKVCEEDKHNTCFGKKISNKDGLNNTCKECRKVLSKIYRNNNSEKIKKYNKEQYYKKKEDRNKHVANYKRERRKVDKVFRLKCNISSLVRQSIKRKGYRKNIKTVDILGCSVEYFKEHIEKQFLKGMSWDNRDKWDLDHIVPMCHVKTEEDVYKLNHWTNFQPMWSEQNRKIKHKKLHDCTNLHFMETFQNI